LDKSNETSNVVLSGRSRVDVDLERLALDHILFVNLLPDPSDLTLLFEKSSFTPLPELECAIVLYPPSSSSLRS
jgi:hypothetical protein